MLGLRLACDAVRLRGLPDERGRGVLTDVRRDPAADRPAAGTANATMTDNWWQMRRTTMVEVRCDHGKATSFDAARPTRPPFSLLAGRLRAIFIDARLQGGMIRSNKLGIRGISVAKSENVGNVGL